MRTGVSYVDTRRDGADESASLPIGPTRRLGLYLLGGLALIGPGYLVALVGRPTLWAPSPFWMVLWALSTFELWFMLPAFAFWLLGLRLALGRDRVSIPGLVFQALLGALSFVWLVGSWSFGLRYQGAFHTVVVSVVSVALFSAAFVVGLFGRKRASYASYFAAHWLFCFWLVWAAFPDLGEGF